MAPPPLWIPADEVLLRNSVEEVPEASSAPTVNGVGPEYCNGVICCMLNTQCREMPPNDDVFLPFRSLSATNSIGARWRSYLRYPSYLVSSSAVRDFPTTRRANGMKILAEILRLIILAICIMWTYYKLVVANYKYKSTMKSFRFSYKKNAKQELSSECSICLSEFAEGEEGREIVECRHIFHRHCLERWLKDYTGAVCPLCKSLVVPKMIEAEYQMMQIEQENNRVLEKELALIFLNALSGGRRSCNNNGFV